MSNENLQKQNVEQMNARVTPLLQWRVYKYDVLEKMPLVRLGIACGVLVLLSIIMVLQKDYFGMATFLAAGVVVTLFLTRKPPIFSCAILPDSIVFQKQRHTFADLDGFAIIADRLIIFPKNNGATIHIPIDPGDGDEIHNFLAEHLEPRGYEPTLLDVLEEFLRI